MFRNKAAAVLRAAGAAVIVSGAGLAAPAIAEESRAMIEEVIVTATKRAASVQDIPVAVTAITEEMEQSSIRKLSDLNGFAPNVRIDETSDRNGLSIQIRGIGPPRTDDNSFDAPIAVTLDGIHLGSLAGINLENFDIERVEVLRGPQGTLFGKNTVGGVIQVIRSRPTGEFGAKMRFTGGQHDRRDLQGVFNMPVIEDTLAAKLFFTSMKDDGHLDNTFLLTNGPKKDYTSYGMTLLWEPTDNFEALFTIERFDDESQTGANMHNANYAPGVYPPPADPRETSFAGGFLSCTLFAATVVSPTFDSDVPCRTSLDIDEDVTTIDLPNPAKIETDAYTLNMNWDLNDRVRLVSLTGYRDGIENRDFDFDGTFSNHITIERDNDYEQFSQELRVEFTSDRLSIVAGGYYWDSEFSQDWTTGGDFWKFVGTLGGYDLTNNTWIADGAFIGVFTPSIGERQAFEAGLSPLEGCWLELFGATRCDTDLPLTGTGDETTQQLFETQTTESIAFFAQADWEFIENWILTLGVRWTEEKKHFIAGQAYLTSREREHIDNFPAFSDLKNKWDEVSPKVGLSWRATEDVLLYAHYSEGFHSGGFFGVNQNIADFERDQYEPEFAENWEVGVKSQWFENRVQVNAAYFRNNFDNKQEAFVAVDTSTNTVATQFSNVANARYQGIDLETRWVINEYVSLWGTLGWLDAEYREFACDLDPNVNPGTISDCSFLNPRGVPEITWGVGGNASFPVGPGELSFFAKYDWVDEIDGQLLNWEIGKVDSRENLTTSATYSYGNFALTVFGQNLTDERTETVFPIPPLFAPSTISVGRTWGITLDVEF